MLDTHTQCLFSYINAHANGRKTLPCDAKIGWTRLSCLEGTSLVTYFSNVYRNATRAVVFRYHVQFNCELYVIIIGKEWVTVCIYSVPFIITMLAICKQPATKIHLFYANKSAARFQGRPLHYRLLILCPVRFFLSRDKANFSSWVEISWS